MTEDQVERRVEKAIDRLDARLMSGLLSQADYDREMFTLDKWAAREGGWAAALERAARRLGT